MPASLASFLRHALPTVLLLAGASAILLATDRASGRRTLPAVAVLQQVSTAVLDDAVRGMLEGLAEKGFIDGTTVTIRRYNAEGDLAQANAIAREIAGGPFDLALTSSTPSLQALATANARGRVVHVFSAVADPFSAGVGLDRRDPLIHPRHLVGYGSLAPVDATFGILQRIGPGVKRAWPTIPPRATRGGSWNSPGPRAGRGASNSSRPPSRTPRASSRRSKRRSPAGPR
jgi:ABC-type uncharacterized transport system substrate-binding protein